MRGVLELSPSTSETGPPDSSVLFIGNATVLLHWGGFTILTDPTFVHRSEQVPLGYGLSTTRLTDPAMDIADLPPLDLVLLSHFHGDHFDQVAERELDRGLPIITTPQAAQELSGRGFTGAIGLDTWQTQVVTKGDGRLRLTAAPGRHGPGVTDLVLPDVMGSILELDTPVDVDEELATVRSIYISGDTLVYDDLHEIPRRYPELDLGMLHLGGTRVMGIMVTMDAEQGVEAMRIVDPRTVIPIHYDDYDVFTSGLPEFLEAVSAAGLSEQVRPLQRGEAHLLA